MYTNFEIINALGTECINEIQLCDNYNEAVSIFQYYGNKMKELGGGIKWFMEDEEEIFQILQPRDEEQ